MTLSVEELDGEILVGCDLGADAPRAVAFLLKEGALMPMPRATPEERVARLAALEQLLQLRQPIFLPSGVEFEVCYVRPGLARLLYYLSWSRYRKRRAAWRGPPNRLAYVCARTVTDACGAPEWYGRIGRAVALAGGAK